MAPFRIWALLTTIAQTAWAPELSGAVGRR